MVDPKFPNGPPDMFICGDDEGAKKTVSDITKSFGWGVIDAGKIDGSRLTEPLCILWVEYGLKTGTWSHAYKLLRK
jgi:predicted dinucleotide-binding enzyme